MEPYVPLADFLDQPCRRCGEPMAAHRIRPFVVAELPDVPAAELICPMRVLDLGTGPPVAHHAGGPRPLQAEPRAEGGR